MGTCVAMRSATAYSIPSICGSGKEGILMKEISIADDDIWCPMVTLSMRVSHSDLSVWTWTDPLCNTEKIGNRPRNRGLGIETIFFLDVQFRCTSRPQKFTHPRPPFQKCTFISYFSPPPLYYIVPTCV